MIQKLIFEYQSKLEDKVGNPQKKRSWNWNRLQRVFLRTTVFYYN